MDSAVWPSRVAASENVFTQRRCVKLRAWLSREPSIQPAQPAQPTMRGGRRCKARPQTGRRPAPDRRDRRVLPGRRSRCSSPASSPRSSTPLDPVGLGSMARPASDLRRRHLAAGARRQPVLRRRVPRHRPAGPRPDPRPARLPGTSGPCCSRSRCRSARRRSSGSPSPARSSGSPVRMVAAGDAAGIRCRRAPWATRWYLAAALCAGSRDHRRHPPRHRRGLAARRPARRRTWR